MIRTKQQIINITLRLKGIAYNNLLYMLTYIYQEHHLHSNYTQVLLNFAIYCESALYKRSTIVSYQNFPHSETYTSSL